jgi:L-methionine (R)-S-oxide reductase
MYYKDLKERVEEVLLNETNFVANAANLAALLYRGLKDINWLGFYLMTKNELVLGPFQGKPACIRIAIGKGVCGHVAKNKEPIIVENVNEFPGHIVCDPKTSSEMVLPLIYDDVFYGVLDIDSSSLNRFSDHDLEEMTDIVDILLNTSDLDALELYYHKH